MCVCVCVCVCFITAVDGHSPRLADFESLKGDGWESVPLVPQMMQGEPATAAGPWAPLGATSSQRIKGSGSELRVPQRDLEFTKKSCPSPATSGELASEVPTCCWTFVRVV